MNKQQITNEANFYIQSNLNERDAAKALGISTRTLQIHLNKLKEINPFLFDLVLKKNESNVLAGRRVGGRKSISKSSYTSKEAVDLALYIIKTQSTYRDAEEKYGIPKTTIYEITHSALVPDSIKTQLDAVSMANKKGIIVDDLLESWKIRR